MYSIYFMKLETHAKLSFHCSDFWPLILPASTTYTKDGAQRHHNLSRASWSNDFRHYPGLHLLNQRRHFHWQRVPRITPHPDPALK